MDGLPSGASGALPSGFHGMIRVTGQPLAAGCFLVVSDDDDDDINTQITQTQRSQSTNSQFFCI